LRRRDIPAGAKRLRERRGLAVSDDEADLAHGQLLLGEQLGSRASRRTALKLISPTPANARCTCRGELASRRVTATVSGGPERRMTARVAHNT